MTRTGIDEVVTRIAAQLNLDRDTEREVLDEIRQFRRAPGCFHRQVDRPAV